MIVRVGKGRDTHSSANGVTTVCGKSGTLTEITDPEVVEREPSCDRCSGRTTRVRRMR